MPTGMLLIYTGSYSDIYASEWRWGFKYRCFGAFHMENRTSVFSCSVKLKHKLSVD